MISLKQAHYIMGILGIIAFLLTGQYMHFVLDHLKETADAPRLLYRSAHIYLLLSAVVNLAIGVYMPTNSLHLRSILQNITSALILFAPLLITLGFFTDADAQNLDRVYTKVGLYAMFIAAILLIFIGRKTK